MTLTNDYSPQRLRQMSAEELTRLGEDSLKERLLEQATFAHIKHAPITPASLAALLADPECVRYPTRLVYEFGEMARHQFAQPDIDLRDPAGNSRVLYLRPTLRDRPDLVLLAVAYMLPVLNYGEIIRDEHCILYGAALLGLMQEDFYKMICELADFVGSEPRFENDAGASCSSSGL